MSTHDDCRAAVERVEDELDDANAYIDRMQGGEELKTTKLREDDLIALGPCARCGKKLLEGDGTPSFFHVTVSTAVLDYGAVRRQVGLALHLGSDAIAKAMGPDEPIAHVMPGTTFMLHQQCALAVPELLGFVEVVGDRNRRAQAKKRRGA